MELRIESNLRHRLTLDDECLKALAEAVTFTLTYKPGASDQLKSVKEALDKFTAQSRDYESLLGGLTAVSDTPAGPKKEQLNDSTTKEEEKDEEPPPPEAPPPPPFDIEPPQ